MSVSLFITLNQTARLSEQKQIWKKTDWSQSYNNFHNIVRLFDILPKFSFHPEWREAWLLVINMAHTNFLTCCWTTYNLESQEIRKYQENLKNSQNNSLVPSRNAKMKILLILAKNSLKNRNSTFPLVRYFKWKLELLSNFL